MQKSADARGVILSAVFAAVLATAVVFAVDRATKLFFMRTDVLITSPIPGVIDMTRHQNYGIIANVPVPRLMIIALTLGVLALVLRALWRVVRSGTVFRACALGVLLGGAFGNLYDRLTMGYVFDWILLGGRSVINLADVAIMLGVALFFLSPTKKYPTRSDPDTASST